MIKDLKRDIRVKHMELQTEMDNQRESMGYVKKLKKSKIKTIASRTNSDQEGQEHVEHLEHTMHSQHAHQKSKPKEVNTEGLEEDLLDLDYDYEEPKSHDSINTSSYVSDDDNADQQKYPGHRKKSQRLMEIREFLTENRRVPERRINEDNSMRLQERCSVCSFCLAKGRHYSDSCPTCASVKS
uniref:CCHC-type domain-containing protein n=1 Tax=Haemonchus placei TaxID=6290 RepID=A0A0N4WTF6_HAEPC